MCMSARFEVHAYTGMQARVYTFANAWWPSHCKEHVHTSFAHKHEPDVRLATVIHIRSETRVCEVDAHAEFIRGTDRPTLVSAYM
jgi:hypothetical protein